MIEESLKMKSLNHPHVLSLTGVSIDAGDAPYIVMPYMANGSLLSFLRKERPNLTIAQDADMELVGYESCFGFPSFQDIWIISCEYKAFS